MNTKYFYYISKTKVDMLLSQLRRSKLAIPKITPKVGVAGIEIEAEISSQARQGLIRDTVSLLTLMTKRKLIKELAEDPAINTRSYWHDESTWFNGLFLFRVEVDLATYFLWKVFQDAIILLIGSPQNILGEKIVRDGVQIPGTSGMYDQILRFVDRNIQPDDIVLATDKRYQDHPYYEWLNLPSVVLELASDAIFLDEFESLPSSSKALSLGFLCLKHLIGLPQSEIDTVFRLFQEYDLEHPRDLLNWGSVLGGFPHITEQLKLVDVRRVFVGSPIYTALK